MFQKIKKELQNKTVNGMIHESVVFTAIAKAKSKYECVVAENNQLSAEVALYKLLQSVPTQFVMGDATTKEWERDIIKAHNDVIEKTSTAVCVPLRMIRGVERDAEGETEGFGFMFNDKLALELNKRINEPTVATHNEAIERIKNKFPALEDDGLVFGMTSSEITAMTSSALQDLVDAGEIADYIENPDGTHVVLFHQDEPDQHSEIKRLEAENELLKQCVEEAIKKPMGIEPHIYSDWKMKQNGNL